MNPTHFAYWQQKSPNERARFRAFLIKAFQVEPCCIHHAIVQLLTANRYIEGGHEFPLKPGAREEGDAGCHV